MSLHVFEYERTRQVLYISEKDEIQPSEGGACSTACDTGSDGSWKSASYAKKSPKDLGTINNN